jgi:membrane protein
MEMRFLSIRELWTLARESVSAWSSDYAPSMGGAIAFYTIFSIAPMLIIIIAVAGLVFGEEAARAELMSQVSDMAGQEAAVAVAGILREASRPGQGLVAMTIGLAVLVVGATTVFAELQSALNRIWQVPDAPSGGGGIWRMILSRIIALVLVVSIAGLLLALVAISTVITALGDVWSAHLGGWEIVLRIVDLIVSLALLTTLFALVYRYVPRADIAWSDVWLGAAVTAVLFIIGRYLIGFYLGTAGIGSAFGAAGSLVVLLMWVYYTAQIFLLGAEFTWVYAHRYGSRAARAEPAASDAGTTLPAPALGMQLVGLAATIGFIIGAFTRRN